MAAGGSRTFLVDIRVDIQERLDRFIPSLDASQPNIEASGVFGNHGHGYIVRPLHLQVSSAASVSHVARLCSAALMSARRQQQQQQQPVVSAPVLLVHLGAALTTPDNVSIHELLVRQREVVPDASVIYLTALPTMYVDTISLERPSYPPVVTPAIQQAAPRIIQRSTLLDTSNDEASLPSSPMSDTPMSPIPSHQPSTAVPVPKPLLPTEVLDILICVINRNTGKMARTERLTVNPALKLGQLRDLIRLTCRIHGPFVLELCARVLEPNADMTMLQNLGIRNGDTLLALESQEEGNENQDSNAVAEEAPPSASRADLDTAMLYQNAGDPNNPIDDLMEELPDDNAMDCVNPSSANSRRSVGFWSDERLSVLRESVRDGTLCTLQLESFLLWLARTLGFNGAASAESLGSRFLTTAYERVSQGGASAVFWAVAVPVLEALRTLGSCGSLTGAISSAKGFLCVSGIFICVSGIIFVLRLLSRDNLPSIERSGTTSSTTSRSSSFWRYFSFSSGRSALPSSHPPDDVSKKRQ